MLYRRSRKANGSGKPHPLQSGLTMFTHSMQTTLRGEQDSEISAIARLAADRRRRLWVIGGRFSQMLAEILWAILRHMRDQINSCRRFFPGGRRPWSMYAVIIS